jgi:hypothetical protein
MGENTTVDHVPDGLTPAGQRARDVVVAFLRAQGRADTGGCRPFYSPNEWKERGEEYGTLSELVIVHDGGDLAPYFNLDYYCYDKYEAMQAALSEHGFYFDQCTSWYSAVYQSNMES